MGNIFAKFIQELKKQAVLFVSLWVILFGAATLILLSYGIAPSALTSEESDEDEIDPNSPTIVDEAFASQAIAFSGESSAPVRIIIDAVDVDVAIENPTSADIATLDDALTRGAVHYPGSGNLEDVSNMFLFGHSSSLPVVNNQNYKAFNDLADLKEGELIRVQSEHAEYHYRVSSVVEMKAEDAWVQFNSSTKKLTLSTCNNFGSKQDRFVVEADFVGSYMLSG